MVGTRQKKKKTIMSTEKKHTLEEGETMCGYLYKADGSYKKWDNRFVLFRVFKWHDY